MIPRILIIAGSDSGGGAGIQADIKTVTMLGGFATTAITAITSQNTQTVSSVHPVPVAHIASQIDAVLDDIGTDTIKTGMLYDTDVIQCVADKLADSVAPLVLDPVMVATSGACLLERDAVVCLKQRLLPCATVVTPNIPEAELLLGRKIATKQDMELAAEEIAGLGVSSVLVKGGHLPGYVVSDLLWCGGEARWFESSRIESCHTHGTGCTLASAVATYLGYGDTLLGAVTKARHYVRGAIESAPGFGQGHGPLNHMHVLKRQ